MTTTLLPTPIDSRRCCMHSKMRYMHHYLSLPLLATTIFSLLCAYHYLLELPRAYRRSKSHFQRGSLVCDDVPYKPPPRILTTSRARRMEPPPRAKFLGRERDNSKITNLTGSWRITPIPKETWQYMHPAGLSSGPQQPISLQWPQANAMAGARTPSQHGGTPLGTPTRGTPTQLLHALGASAGAPGA